MLGGGGRDSVRDKWNSGNSTCNGVQQPFAETSQHNSVFYSIPYTCWVGGARQMTLDRSVFI